MKFLSIFTAKGIFQNFHLQKGNFNLLIKNLHILILKIIIILYSPYEFNIMILLLVGLVWFGCFD